MPILNGNKRNKENDESSSGSSKKRAFTNTIRKEVAGHTNEDISKSLLREPPILSKKEDTITVASLRVGEKSGVTALTIVPIKDVKQNSAPFLFSGHENGVICKWDLANNCIIWKKKIFQAKTFKNNKVEEYHDDNYMKTGVRGIAVKYQSSKTGNHYDEVYTWSHNFEPNNRSPSKLHVLNGTDGTLLYSLVCEFDDVDTYPLISCVIFSKLSYTNDSSWDESVIVGLQATTEILDDDDHYSDFDLDEAEDFAHGNILPFTNRVPNESWRGHSGSIRSMATIPDKYIVSCSELLGQRRTEMIILWCTNQPGVPLHRIDLRKYNLQKESLPSGYIGKKIRGGIATFGNSILFCCNSGETLVPLEIVEKDIGGNNTANNEMKTTKSNESSMLVMKGYSEVSDLGNIYTGFLVGDGNVAAINNQDCEEVWIFPVNSVAQDPTNCDDIPFRANGATCGSAGEDDKVYCKKVNIRSLADAQVKFPRQKNKSGPEVLDIKGRLVVAGYSCGTILKSALLPERYMPEVTKRDKYNSNVSSYLGESEKNCTPHFDALKQAPVSRPESCIIQ